MLIGWRERHNPRQGRGRGHQEPEQPLHKLRIVVGRRQRSHVARSADDTHHQPRFVVVVHVPLSNPVLADRAPAASVLDHCPVLRRLEVVFPLERLDPVLATVGAEPPVYVTSDRCITHRTREPVYLGVLVLELPADTALVLARLAPRELAVRPRYIVRERRRRLELATPLALPLR